MDLAKIGKFIQDLRKAKKLTQVELALKIGVSEKTISKWECGKGFPDTTLMLPLCKELGITANELLSGKLLPNEKEYKAASEENLVLLKSQQEKSSKHLLTIEYVLGYFVIALSLLLIMIAAYFELSLGWRIALIVLGFVHIGVGVHFCLKIEQTVGYYECAKCHNKYVPTYKSVLWAMHVGRTRYMKCPKCGKHSWNKKTISKE